MNTSLPLPASQRLEQALSAIASAGEEGSRIFTHVDAERARAEARAADERAAQGLSLGPLDGRIVAVKDLLDVAGIITTAGSKLLKTDQPAQRDATVVQRLRQGGAVIVGKTNMTEFAFSGVGLNPHYGTPGNARDVSRIPGGSSSGAGVSVARGMAEIAIGSDTGGSIRIPSALNGLVGFKPTRSRVPTDGAFPLSFTLDALGPLATNVADAAAADSVLSGTAPAPLPQRSIKGLRLGVPRGLLFSQTEDEVLQAFEQAVSALSTAGARVSDESLDELLAAPFRLQEKGTLIAAEAAFIHERNVAEHPNEFDPIVLGRIQKGQTVTASHYVSVQQARNALLPQLDQALADFDALILPTVAFVAPRIADVQSESDFSRVNALILRNTSVFNFYDLPALSLPLPRAGKLPIGLMVVGHRLADRELLAIGTAIEALLKSA